MKPVDPCICTFPSREGLGHYDTVTGEWGASAVIQIVTHKRNPDCPRHRVYYLNDEVRVVKDFGDGWIQCAWPGGKFWKTWKDSLCVGKPFSGVKLGV